MQSARIEPESNHSKAEVVLPSSEYIDRPLTMSVTQSNSFESLDVDGSDLKLSASDDSFNDLQHQVDSRSSEGSIFDDGSDCDIRRADSNLSSNSSSVASSKTGGSKQSTFSGQGSSWYGPMPHGYPVPPYSGTQGHPPPYHPHYPSSYYPNGGNRPQYQYENCFPPKGPQQGPFHPMHYSQPQYNPHISYHNPAYSHGIPPPNSMPYVQNTNSSANSVSSQGSNNRKRTIDGLLEEDARNMSFSKHRSSSNNSTCSTTTAGNNTSSETFNRLLCDSPLKRERVLSPTDEESRRDSGESKSNIMGFGSLNVGAEVQGEVTVASNVQHRRGDKGITPLIKNSREREELGQQFSFDESDTQGKRFSSEELSLNKQLRNQSFTPLSCVASKRKTTSPTFDEQLEIAPQLSWSMASDTPALGDLVNWPKTEGNTTSNDDSPISFTAGQISPMLFMSISEDSNDDVVPTSNEKKHQDIMREGLLSPTNGCNTPFVDSGNKSFGPRQQHVRHSAHKVHGHIPIPYFTPSKVGMIFSPYPNMDRREENNARNFNSDGREGPSPITFKSPHGAMPPNGSGSDRIRNLRGRVPVATVQSQLHLPPHFPSHPLFLTSPIGTNPKDLMLPSPQPVAQAVTSLQFPHSPHLNSSKKKCVPLKAPLPSKFAGDIEKHKKDAVPDFTSLVNFPHFMASKQSSRIPEGMRCCVMCGHACPCSSTNKTKKERRDGSSNSGVDSVIGGRSNYAIIPSQNKGLCTQCDVNVFVVQSTKLQIKWCKGCKNFRPWASFGDKGLATKCVRCRERQREKYALQKEDKDKKKAARKGMKKAVC